MAYADYEAVIGLEIHAQLKTESKMFCSCSAAFGESDNQNTCPVCTGQPGALPVVNRRAIELAMKMGKALQCEIRDRSVFARKNYFYPDMPRGYQISQYERPICADGKVEFYLDGRKRTVRIERAHLEEDAGKSTHHGDYSLINLNRASTPLLEIVSGPDLRSAEEAAQYAREVRKILRYQDVCDGNLEEGSMRCDCNVSVRKKGDPKLGTKVEIKNINSFRFVEKAVAFEIERQIDCLESGQSVVQETRLYDIDKNRTFTMRTKEDAEDYRYFPEPDLLPVDLRGVRVEAEELPSTRYERLISDYRLPEADADQLTQEKALADYFEEAAKAVQNPKLVANWMLGELTRLLNDEKLSIERAKVRACEFGRLIELLEKDEVSGKMAKVVLGEMWSENKTAREIIEKKGLKQVKNTGEIEVWVRQVIAANEKQVAELRSGKQKIFDYLVGQVMRLSKGQAHPDLVRETFKKILEE